MAGWTEKIQSTSQSQTCTKKRSWSLVVCCWSDALQLSESWQKCYIREVCSANWWDVRKTATPAAGIDQQKGPSSHWQHLTKHHTISASKVEQIGLWKFALSAIFTWHLANWLPRLQASWQLFAGKMFQQPAGGRRCFPRVCQIPKRGFLCYRSNKLISHWQKCVDWMVPILINKDVFEPSYNLKFMVKNCNYFCSNLIILTEEQTRWHSEYTSHWSYLLSLKIKILRYNSLKNIIMQIILFGIKILTS